MWAPLRKALWLLELLGKSVAGSLGRVNPGEDAKILGSAESVDEWEYSWRNKAMSALCVPRDRPVVDFRCGKDLEFGLRRGGKQRYLEESRSRERKGGVTGWGRAVAVAIGSGNSRNIF
ncbi:hypothetical protein H1C71_013522 [Ictidomys tridecemlineatus]|nr:hypothetical protein H1C71_013522 [Ictidomys tridecemlineatus]